MAAALPLLAAPQQQQQQRAEAAAEASRGGDALQALGQAVLYPGGRRGVTIHTALLQLREDAALADAVAVEGGGDDSGEC